MLQSLNITWVDLIDILIVGFLIYKCIMLFKGTAAMGIIYGIILLIVVWIVVSALDMELLSTILDKVFGVGFIALIVIFQQEIRRFLIRLGNGATGSGNKLFQRIFHSGARQNVSSQVLEELTSACQHMSETKTGALIVMSHEQSLSSIIETGDEIDALVNRRLIENIFFKNTPLHDGAMVMTKDKLVAARCTLPITQRQDIPPRYGMRHRAAVGVSEETDATVIVVSEETGEITFISKGEMKTTGSIQELRMLIENSYK